MYFGLMILIAGLAISGVTLFKILSGAAEEKIRQWYGLALAGVFLSLMGLVLTLRGMRDLPKASKIGEVTGQEQKINPVIAQPGETGTQPTATPELQLPSNATDFMRRQMEVAQKFNQEDPNGQYYAKEDFDFFDGQVNLGMDGFDQLIKETITGSPPPEKAGIPKYELWNNFNFNLDVYMR